MIDFIRNCDDKVSVIHDKDVLIVESFKYLGTVLDCKLMFYLSTIVK